MSQIGTLKRLPKHELVVRRGCSKSALENMKKNMADFNEKLSRLQGNGQ
jgi:hypothetical protein